MYPFELVPDPENVARDLIICREKEFRMRVYLQAEEEVDLPPDAIKFYSDDHGEPLLFHVLQPELFAAGFGWNNQLYRSAIAWYFRQHQNNFDTDF